MSLYFITETEKGYDSHTWLTDKLEKDIIRKDYTLTCRVATEEEITLAILINSIESEMESANYHRMVFLPGWFSQTLLKHLPEPEVKKIFLDLVNDKGLLWSE